MKLPQANKGKLLAAFQNSSASIPTKKAWSRKIFKRTRNLRGVTIEVWGM